MLVYPHIDPVAVSLGPLKVHWYGLMYLLAFGTGYGLALWRIRRSGSGWTADMLSDLLFYIAMGVILGGRLGYVVFYGFDRLVDDPLWALRVWEGGMSFHGGLLGVLIAVAVFCRQYQKPWFDMMDFVAPLVPTGLLFGRIGNFIGGELWGRPVVDQNFPLAMVFPHVDNLARHPSQLYEAALEGLVLFVLLWWYSARPRPRMAVSGLFLAGYGAARFTVEFFRQPDADKGFILFDWMTMGQILTTPMILGGLVLMLLAYRNERLAINVPTRTPE
ncbi:MAG TPA: prolipoprotein diacylglyceryl transferase [Moraxellaceae bacterium]|nr:prolipoprotein diacylglyceryl transferase [Moraxellaceae bacterium]